MTFFNRMWPWAEIRRLQSRNRFLQSVICDERRQHCERMSEATDRFLRVQRENDGLRELFLEAHFRDPVSGRLLPKGRRPQ